MRSVIVVTGASRGIGRATARCLAAADVCVVANYCHNKTAAESLCEEIIAARGHAVAAPADLRDEAGVVALFEQVDALGLPLTGLVNNAGISGQIMPFTEYTEARIQQTLAINVLGPMLIAREAIKRMLQRGEGGAIVNVSSAAARIGSPNEFIDYAASKAALDTMTLGLAKEFGARGIRVNAVRPGIIRTEIHAAAGAPDRVERMGPQVPLARAGEAEEVATTIAWLLSDAASYVTGALLDVAGGR